MEKLLPPYRIEISTSILCIYFDKIVTADVFFANCADIQQILEEGPEVDCDQLLVAKLGTVIVA